MAYDYLKQKYFSVQLHKIMEMRRELNRAKNIGFLHIKYSLQVNVTAVLQLWNKNL